MAIEHFSHPDALRSHRDSVGLDDIGNHFLVDYEFVGVSENGLELIQDLALIGRSTLVTSRYDEVDLQKRCMELGVKLLPKSLAGVVPIHVVAR